MDEKDINSEIEIDFLEILNVFKRAWKWIAFSTISVALLVMSYTHYFIPPEYSSEATIFLAPKVNESGFIETYSVSSNNYMVNTYMSFIRGDSILQGVTEILGKRATTSQIRRSLSVSNDENTQIIRIRSTTLDPQLSKDIVDAIVNQFTSEMLEKLNVQNITIIDYPKVNKSPVSPNKRKNGIMGGIAGFMFSSCIVFIRMFFNKKLRNKNEAESYLGIPVLVEIPYYKG